LIESIRFLFKKNFMVTTTNDITHVDKAKVLYDLLRIRLQQLSILQDQLLEINGPACQQLTTHLGYIQTCDDIRVLNLSGIDSIIDDVNKAINAYETKSDSKAFDRCFETLFNPKVLNEEEVSKCRVEHGRIYSEMAVNIAERMHQQNIPNYILESGMYAGKSTLAFKITEELRKRYGYNVFRIVPFFMKENFVEVRGEEGQNGQKSHRAYADMIHPSDWEGKVNDIIKQCNGANGVVHFDEYSWMDPAIIDQIVQKLNSHGIKVILAGLDSDYLGNPAPGYKFAVQNYYSPELNNKDQCKSFDGTHDFSKAEAPQGTMTARYLRLKHSKGYFMIRDNAFGQPVITKDNQYVQYVPQKIDLHVSTGNPRIHQSLSNPNPIEIETQQALTDRLNRRDRRDWQNKLTPQLRVLYQFLNGNGLYFRYDEGEDVYYKVIAYDDSDYSEKLTEDEWLNYLTRFLPMCLDTDGKIRFEVMANIREVFIAGQFEEA
jgi:thymidine kinase